MTSAERRLHYLLLRCGGGAYADDLGRTDQELDTFVKRGFLHYHHGSWSLRRIYQRAA